MGADGVTLFAGVGTAVVLAVSAPDEADAALNPGVSLRQPASYIPQQPTYDICDQYTDSKPAFMGIKTIED